MNKQQEFESIIQQLNQKKEYPKRTIILSIIGFVVVTFLTIHTFSKKVTHNLKQPKGLISLELRVKSYLTSTPTSGPTLATLYLNDKVLVKKIYLESLGSDHSLERQQVKIMLPPDELKKVLPYLDHQNLKALPYKHELVSKAQRNQHEIVF